jgi:hypothetical protein
MAQRAEPPVRPDFENTKKEFDTAPAIAIHRFIDRASNFQNAMADFTA